MLYRVPLVFTPQDEGGFVVTSPALPELITEGDTMEEAFSHAREALATVVELYTDTGRDLPSGLVLSQKPEVVWSEALVEAP